MTLPAGAYEFDGTIWLRANAALDWALATQILNHEECHREIAVSTPFAFVQIVLRALRPAPWATPVPMIDRILANLALVSRGAYEAIASYASALEEDARASLPDEYREGADLFARFFESRKFDTLAKKRITLALGARAFQTPIITHWTEASFNIADEYSSYLRVAENQPNHRLRVILDELKNQADADVARWAGTLEVVRGSLVLNPPTPHSVGGLTFEALGDPSKVLDRAINLSKRLAPAGVDVDVSDLAMQLQMAHHSYQAAIGPESGGFFLGPPDDIDWFREADFVKLDINMFEGPMQFDETLTIPPFHALAHVTRPDYSIAHSAVVPLDEIGLLLSVTVRRDATICVPSGLGLIPPPGSYRDGDPMDVLSWLDDWRVVIGCMGPPATLVETLTFLTYKQEERGIIFTAVEPGVEAPWFYLLMRYADKTGPMVIHPLLAHVWEQERDSLEPQYNLQFRPGSGFFSNTGVVVDFTRFARFFMGWALPLQGWAALLQLSERELTDDKNVKAPGRQMRTATRPWGRES